MSIKEIECIIESVLFASGEPVSINKLKNIIKINEDELENIINNIILRYNNERGGGLQIVRLENALQLCTKPEYYEYIKKIVRPREIQTLSTPVLETLAIIAYNQPITKVEIDDIRKVNSDSSISKLVEKNFIYEKDRLSAPGRPILYATTEEFLRFFGLSSLSSLKNFHQLDMFKE